LDQLLDSLPIMLAVRNRSYHAKVARDQADQTFCESKKLWYYGVKLHLLGRENSNRQLPVPLSLCLTEASRHDLPVLREQVLVPCRVRFLGTKPTADPTTQQTLATQGTGLCTPDIERERADAFTTSDSVGCGHCFVSAMRPTHRVIFSIGCWTKLTFRMPPKFVPVKACWCIATVN
jgi:hypothetical protein